MTCFSEEKVQEILNDPDNAEKIPVVWASGFAMSLQDTGGFFDDLLASVIQKEVNKEVYCALHTAIRDIGVWCSPSDITELTLFVDFTEDSFCTEYSLKDILENALTDHAGDDASLDKLKTLLEETLQLLKKEIAE